MKNSTLFFLLLFSLQTALAQEWKTLQCNNESTARGENSLVAMGDKLYLFGSRGMKPMEVLDTKTMIWTQKSGLPLEMHHFQAVAYEGEIYVLGALTGPYPHEKPIPNVYIYNPGKDEWRVGPEIPRKRGSAGCFVYKGKIYLVAGIIDGHWDGHVKWFDEFDPKTGEWKELPDAPHARDHISVAVTKDKLVVAAGRRSQAKTNEVMAFPVEETDVFDFKKMSWSTVAGQSIPTRRAGPGVGVLGTKVVFLGGESADQVPAHSEVEAFDVKSNTWSKMPPLNRGRHGMSAAQIKKKIYVSSGVGNRGGNPELNSIECLGCK